MGGDGCSGRLLALPQLDFLHLGNVAGEVRVHAPGNEQLGVLVLHGNGQLQRNLRLPSLPQLTLTALVPQHALLHVPQGAAGGVDVLPMKGELHQSPHRYPHLLRAPILR